MEIKLGKYRHYKGDVVEVIGEALHSETLEKFVCYRHVTGKRKDEKYYWVRPIEMFLENVLIDGKEVKRFEYIGE